MVLVLQTPDRWIESCDKQWHNATFQTLRSLHQMLPKKRGGGYEDEIKHIRTKDIFTFQIKKFGLQTFNYIHQKVIILKEVIVAYCAVTLKRLDKTTVNLRQLVNRY